jgi:hypothetical protein
MQHLHIDIETYSSVDITSAGAYKYAESLDFEILMMAYAFDDEEVEIIDFAQGETAHKGQHVSFRVPAKIRPSDKLFKIVKNDVDVLRC